MIPLTKKKDFWNNRDLVTKEMKKHSASSDANPRPVERSSLFRKAIRGPPMDASTATVSRRMTSGRSLPRKVHWATRPVERGGGGGPPGIWEGSKTMVAPF